MAKVTITIEDDGDDGVQLSVQGLPATIRTSGPLTPAQALALTIQERYRPSEPVFEYAGVDD